MKKKLLILNFIILTILLLVSCHGNKALPEFVIPEELEDREFNLTFWAKNDTNKTQQEIYDNAIKEFNKYYPNIHIEITQYRDYPTIYSDVIKNISTKTTPNVCIAYPDHVATYLDGTNIVVPLDELMNDENYGLGGSKIKFESINKSDIIDKFLEECIIDEKYYILPFQRSTEALYINKTYVENLGFTIPDVVTWDFIWEVCAKAIEQKQEGTNLYPLIYKSVDNMMIQLLKQKNLAYTSSNKDIYLFNENTKQILLELQDYADKKYFDIFDRVSYPGNHFNRGNCIFAIDSTAGATWMGGDAPLQDIKEDERASFETIVKAIPQVDENNPQMISQGPSICVFNKTDSQEVLASWIFAQFLLNTETQIQYSKTEGYLPVTKLAIESKEYENYLNDETEYKVKIDATKVILDNIDNTFITPVFSGSSLVRSASGYLIQGIYKPKYKGSSGIDLLFEDTYSLYNLNTVVNEDSKSLNNSNSKVGYILIGTIVIIWVGIGIYVILDKSKNKQKIK